jgi:hypothetical protein
MSTPSSMAYVPPPRSTWWSRHGKAVLQGAAVTGGAVVIGGVAYFILEGLGILGGGQPPACVALQNELYALQKEMLAIYQQAAQQGGTFTQSQASAVQSLQTQIADVINSMSSVCIATPGQTLESTIDQIIHYGLWIAVDALGIIGATYALRWLILRWGGSIANPGNPPGSPGDVDLPPKPQGGATGGADTANAEAAAEYDAGQISGDELEAVAANIAADDPGLGIYGTISDYYAAAAASASDAAAVLLDALADLWAALTDILYDAYVALLALLGL